MASNILLSPKRSMEEIEKAARKKGRAYWCLRCLHRSNKEYIDVKYRMEAHVIKDHLRRDEVPYYCSLCQFRCTKEEELKEHLTRYRRHKTVAQQSGLDPLDPSCLKTNAEPYKIGPKDYLVLDKEESFQHWKTGIIRRQASTDPEPDSLVQAMAEVLGDFEESNPSPFTKEQDQPVFLVNDQTLGQLPALPAATVTLPQGQLKEVVSPILAQLSNILDPAILAQMLSPRQQSLQVAQPPASMEPKANMFGGKEEVRNTVLTVSEQRDEDLLEQLLPDEDQGITPKRKYEGTLIPNKVMRSRSPSPAPSECSSESCASLRELPVRGTSDSPQVSREMRALTNVVMSNTMALRSLEQSVLTLAEAVTVLTKNVKVTDQLKSKAHKVNLDENKNSDSANKVHAPVNTKHINNEVTERSNDRRVMDSKSHHTKRDRKPYSRPFQHHRNGRWNGQGRF